MIMSTKLFPHRWKQIQQTNRFQIISTQMGKKINVHALDDGKNYFTTNTGDQVHSVNL